MQTQEFTLKASDGLELFAQSWEPETPPKAIVCLVHGFGEHLGRYTHVAQAFADAGYAMVAFDQRGHGRSPGRRGHTPSYNQSMDDIGSLISAARDRYADLPVFLYGHSMGGNMVLNYVLRRKPKLVGALVTSPWLRLAFEPPKAQQVIGRLIGKVWPSFTVTNKFEDGVLSRDPAVDAAYRSDPNVHGSISSALFNGVSDAGEWVIRHAGEWPIPMLLLHGSSDKVTSHSATREFSRNAPNKLVTFKTWEGLFHETHNETNKEEVIAANIAWLDNQLQAQKNSR